MRLRTLVCVTSAALVIAGCSSVDLTAPVEDRSTPAPGTSSFLPEQSAQSVPVPVQSQPSHLKAEPQPESSGRTHTVAEGDTIYNISVRYGCNPRELMALNGITDPTTLAIGRELVVPVSRDDGSAPNRAAYEQQANVSEGETLAVGTITTAERPATPEEVVERTRLAVIDLLKQQLKPEFLNRIDEIVMFEPLTHKDIERIVDIQLGIVRRMLSENGIRLEYSDKAREWIASAGYDPLYGARPVKRVIQRYVVNDLSKRILAGEVDRSKPIAIDAGQDGLTFSN